MTSSLEKGAWTRGSTAGSGATHPGSISLVYATIPYISPRPKGFRLFSQQLDYYRLIMDFFAADASRVAVSTTSTDTPDPFAEAIGRRFSGAAAPMLTAKLVLEESPLDNPALHATLPGKSNTRLEGAGGAMGVVPSLGEAGRSRSSQAAATLSNMTLRSPSRGASPSSPSNVAQNGTSPSDVSSYVAVGPKELSIYLAQEPPPLVIDVRTSGAHALSHIRGAISLSVPSTLLKRPNFPLANLATMIASSIGQAAFAQWPSATRILVYDADLSRLTEGSGVSGLLRKFMVAGSKAQLAWLVGGHNAVARLARDCLEAGGPPPSEPEPPSAVTNGTFVHAHSLPQSAFQQSSTVGGPSHKPNRLQASNPFYDNIRQNRELSHGITERIPLQLSQDVISRKDEIPVPWIRDIVENSDREKGIEALAMQFYRIELGEQRRLQGVMSHHSKESHHDTPQQDDVFMHDHPHDPFPFSITAGIEKGAKNRYKNIWPYEHARVRLQTSADDGSDYVNASYVRPRGTNLQYIATQGPLPATYADFWTMVWEQHVHVIVMLTRQVEGNQLKCGDYWSGTQFGPLRLQLIATEGGKEEVVEKPTGFDFGIHDKHKIDDESQSTIRRTFALSHSGHPEEPSRKIVQFQFLSWLDMNVPETPAGLLNLVKSVREAAEEADKYNPAARPNPVLVHCSAGVGRTGSFVAIDAILDGVRRELEATRPSSLEPSSSDDPSDSDLDTSADPSSESAGSSKVRRGSFPEDMTSHRKSNLQMTSARPRRRSLRKTLGAKKGADTGTGTGIGSGPAEKHGSKRNHLAAGAKPGSSSMNETNSGSSRLSSDSSASLYFSEGSLPVSATTVSSNPQSNGKRIGPPGLGPSAAMQATHAWSSDVASTASRSDLVAPQPVPAALGTATPRPDSEMRDRDRDTFDYVFPRSLGPRKQVSPLGSMDEPIREVLEDMREQRMSLCQSLRQYVFVHRAVVEGALAMVDESKKRQGDSNSGLGAKRHASPTELVKVDKAGSRAQIKKRPSLRLGKDTMMVDS
ncbi:protein-tyrosine phosphatase [Rhizoctonia solani]|uniref:protein-tyrosine-phosphatase n=1 Tax=Rhizoctonia solani TaxID=456999 RepID=A0A0K6GDG8_9AGAM|nr:protein-tyrosine phosphatase [Rhizoctonia solani]